MVKKRRRKSTRPEMLHRNVLIRAFDPSLRFGVKGENDPEPEIECRPRLELRGKLIEPIRDTFDVVFRLWPDPDKRVGPNRPVSVAYITGIRPAVEVIANFAPADFSYLWSFALSGHLSHAYMVLTKPHYGSADVLSLSFSTEVEE